jgi:hypothetical protein
LFAAVSAAFPAHRNTVEASNAKATGLVGNPAPEFTLPDLKQQTSTWPIVTNS